MSARTSRRAPPTAREGLVGDVMSRRVHITAPEATVLSAVRTMRRHRISGLPVVSAGGLVKGVVSEKDVVRGLNSAAGVKSDRGLLELLLAARRVDHPNLVDLCEEWLAKTRVEQVMSAPPILVDPEASLTDAAQRLLRYNVNRLPVVQGRHLVGMVTRQDLLGALRGRRPSGGVSELPRRAEARTPPEGPGPLDSPGSESPL